MISRKGITRKLDKALSTIVRTCGSCRRCGKKKNLQCAHIFSRNNRSVRWDFKNVVCLCAGCHFWAHANPVLFTEWVRQFLGEDKYATLKLQANTIRQFATYELEGLYAKFVEIAG
jgi:hypothetical protein